MNKFKHLTPTNIAPLGKRQNNVTSMIKKEQEQQHHKPVIISHNDTKPPQSSSDQTHLNTQSFQIHQLHNQNIPQNTLVSQNLQAQHHAHQTISNISQHQLWTCELCNRILPTREEWTAHAKAHMEVKSC